MGLILDTSILIDAERRGYTVQAMLQRIRAHVGESDVALSAVCVVELTHGIYRAHNSSMQQKRRSFCDELYSGLLVYPLTL